MARKPIAIALDIAWIHYCCEYRLIAYGELTGNETKEYVTQYVERRAREMYEEEVKEIRSKYESNDCKS